MNTERMASNHRMNTIAESRHLTLSLSPSGHLLCASDPQAEPLPESLAERLVPAFEIGAGEGLLHLGVTGATQVLPPAWAWWRDFAVRYVTARCTHGEELTPVSPPDVLMLATIVADAPPMTGAEYLAPETLVSLWNRIEAALDHTLATSGQTLAAFLQSLNPA